MVFFFSNDIGILADLFSPFFCYFLPYLPSDSQPLKDSPQVRAISGIAYYISPPHTHKEAVLDLIHTAIYIAFILSACALFSDCLYYFLCSFF